MRILLAVGAQSIADNLLHRLMHIQIVETVAQPRLPCAVDVRGNEFRPARIMPVEVLDDDSRLRDDLVPCIVGEHRKLADGPQLQQRRALVLAGEIDHIGPERRSVLIQRDQHLVAVRRQGVKMQRERHTDGSSSVFVLLDKSTVLIGGAEINIDAFDLVTFEAEELGIPEVLSTLGHAFVGHKGLIAFDEDSFELMPFDPVGIAPAAYEISGLVDLVVIWAREPEIVSERDFDGLAVVRQVGGKDGADDLRSVAIGHRAFSYLLLRFVAQDHDSAQTSKCQEMSRLGPSTKPSSVIRFHMTSFAPPASPFSTTCISHLV